MRRVLDLAARADVTLRRRGPDGATAPLHEDGFIDAEELAELQRLGAVGEIVGRAFDANGAYVQGGVNLRVCSARVVPGPERLVVGIAAGPDKVVAVRAVLNGGLLNGLITDERTARALLD